MKSTGEPQVWVEKTAVQTSTAALGVDKCKGVYACVHHINVKCLVVYRVSTNCCCVVHNQSRGVGNTRITLHAVCGIPSYREKSLEYNAPSHHYIHGIVECGSQTKLSITEN